jgi:predicted dehydrogenase
MKNSVKISTRKSPDWSEENLTVDFNQLYLSQVKNFFRACNDQPAELISGEWALATMHVIEAIRRSNAYSSAVRIPLYD